jgi:flagellar hook-associated protein 1
MTDLLTLGSSGLRAYMRAMGTIGDNIANAQTPGYARRTTQIGETLPASVSSLASRNEASSGLRVMTTERIANQWRIDDARNAAADAGLTGTALRWAEATEDALAQNGNDVGSALGEFFNAADLLSADPASVPLRERFLQSTGQIAASVRQTSGALSDLSAAVATEAGAAVQQANSDFNALHRVNISLLRSTDGSDNRAALLDERDRLLDRISEALPISADYGEHGEVTLRAAAPGNPLLLDNSGAVALSFAASSDGRLSFAVGESALDADSGSLAGLGRAADHIADQSAALDMLAARIIADLNAAHAAGTTPLGNPGAALFSMTSAADLTANPLSAADVAAADASGPSGAMLGLSALRGAGGIEASWAQQLAGQSLFANQQRSEDSAAAARRDAAVIARSEGSAVDLDQEAADLLRFQQAYQAAARVIQVARENMQTIMNAL